MLDFIVYLFLFLVLMSVAGVYFYDPSIIASWFESLVIDVVSPKDVSVSRDDTTLAVNIRSVANDAPRQDDAVGAGIDAVAGVGVGAANLVRDAAREVREHNRIEGGAGGETLRRRPVEEPEVYLIQDSVFKQEDAEAACYAQGAKLATLDQVVEAQNRGADWCFQGWVKGQMAVQPTQPATQEALKEDGKEGRCGRAGVNGGYFTTPGMRFGVHCQGVKPANWKIQEAKGQLNIPKTPEELRLEKKAAKQRRQVNEIVVQPFNKNRWALKQAA